MTWQIMRSIHFELHTTLFLCECVIYSISGWCKSKAFLFHLCYFCTSSSINTLCIFYTGSLKSVWHMKNSNSNYHYGGSRTTNSPIHIAQYYTLMPFETWFDIVGGSVWLCSMLLPFISYALCSLSSNHTPFGVDCCYCSCSLFFSMQKFHSIITQHRLSCASLVFSYTQTPLI